MKRTETVNTTLGDLIVALTDETLKIVPQRRQAYRIVASMLAGFSIDRGDTSAGRAALRRRFTAALRLACLIGALMMSACTSTFEPRVSAGSLEQPRLPTAKEVRGGVEVAIEEYLSSHKSRRAFDADLGPSGVLPILIHVENKSSQNYRIERKAIRAHLNGQLLANLYGIEAAETGALRNPAWNALVNTAAMGPLAMFFGVGAIAGSASQTQKINRQIEQHFERMELTDRIVKPTETAAGFVFFKMPAGTTSLDSMIFEMILEAEPIEGYPARQLAYRFTMPAH